MARCSQSEHTTGLDDGCRTRSGRVIWIEGIGVVHFIGESPERLPGFLVKTVNTLPRLGLLRFGVGDIDAAPGHDGTGVSRPHRRAPANLQSLSREGLQNAGFVPDTIAVRPAELRPILCPHCQRQPQGKRSRQTSQRAFARRARSASPEGPHLKTLSAIHGQGDAPRSDTVLRCSVPPATRLPSGRLLFSGLMKARSWSPVMAARSAMRNLFFPTGHRHGVRPGGGMTGGGRFARASLRKSL